MCINPTILTQNQVTYIPYIGNKGCAVSLNGSVPFRKAVRDMSSHISMISRNLLPAGYTASPLPNTISIPSVVTGSLEYVSGTYSFNGISRAIDLVIVEDNSLFDVLIGNNVHGDDWESIDIYWKTAGEHGRPRDAMWQVHTVTNGEKQLTMTRLQWSSVNAPYLLMVGGTAMATPTVFSDNRMPQMISVLEGIFGEQMTSIEPFTLQHSGDPMSKQYLEAGYCQRARHDLSTWHTHLLDLLSESTSLDDRSPLLKAAGDIPIDFINLPLSLGPDHHPRFIDQKAGLAYWLKVIVGAVCQIPRLIQDHLPDTDLTDTALLTLNAANQRLMAHLQKQVCEISFYEYPRCSCPMCRYQLSWLGCLGAEWLIRWLIGQGVLSHLDSPRQSKAVK